VFVRIARPDPYRLDFKTTYCYNCEEEHFYRVSPIVIDEGTQSITDPVLRFQCDFTLSSRFV
jgi:hypothetical protein